MGVCRVDTAKGHRELSVRYALNDCERSGYMRKVIGKEDAYILFSAGKIAVIDGKVMWLDEAYSGAMDDVKRLAKDGKLKAGPDGLYEEE